MLAIEITGSREHKGTRYDGPRCHNHYKDKQCEPRPKNREDRRRDADNALEGQKAIVDGAAPADLTVTSLSKALPYSQTQQERAISRNA
jgi:hypothetical protein